MKAYFVLIALLTGFSVMTCTPTKHSTIKTKIIEVNSLNAVNSLALNFCDSFSLEITGLYPILDSLPSVTTDSTLVKQLLLDKGFTQLDAGWGNWTKGPRFLYLKFNKGDCTCETFKKYYYNKKMPDGSYDLRVAERIICNSTCWGNSYEDTIINRSIYKTEKCAY
jgi:hypothetical protein